MTAPRNTAARAIHIGAEASSEYAGWRVLRSCRDAVARMARLCAASGITHQQCIVGDQATRQNLMEALSSARNELPADGLLVLTWVGHSKRDTERKTHWCLADGMLALSAVNGLLADFPPTTRIVVIADTCYAATLATVSELPAPLLLLAACGDEQSILDFPKSEFICRLEELIANGAAEAEGASLQWLRAELERDAPDVACPVVWTNRPDQWRRHPFSIATP